jgi:hypothetical protein
MTTLESLLWQLYEGQTDVLAQIGDLLEEAGDARAQEVRAVDLTPMPVRVFVQIGPPTGPVQASTIIAAADEGELSVRLKEVEDSSGGHYLADTMPTLGSAAAESDARLRAARDVLRLFPEVTMSRGGRGVSAPLLAAAGIRPLPPLWPETESAASYPTSAPWGQSWLPLAEEIT